MRFMVRKSVIREIAKSMRNEDDSFEKVKREIIAHLRSLEDKEDGAEIEKALAFIKSQEHMFSYLEKSLGGEWIEKAGYSVGTVRIWKGRKYKKVAPDKWVRVFDKTDRGAKNAITRLVHRAERIDTLEEMMQFVLLNKQRFSDANGKPLDIVDRLQKVIDAKNEGFDKKSRKKKMDSILYERTESVHAKMSQQPHSVEKKRPLANVRNVAAPSDNIAQQSESVKADDIPDARRAFSMLSDILEKGHKQTVENPELGEISIEAGETGKSGWGLKHIIEQRYKKDGKNADDIAALIPLVVGAAKDGKITRENNKLYELEKNGIIAIIRKADDKSGKWILTGFENWDKQKEATDSIKTVNAKYGYAPEYSHFRKQVGAVIASIEETADAVKTGNAKYGYAPEYSHFRKQAGAAVASTDNVSRKGGKVKKSLKDIRKHYESSKSVLGNKKSIYVGDEKIKGHWKLVEADAPMASHDESTFQKTDGFPTSRNGGTVNDRDYEHDKDAQESVRDIAANFNGRALDMGEPVIVTKDGIVVSGNNRTMSSKLAAKKGTDKAYLEDLREQIEDFGFDEDDLDGFRHPRVVFEIDNEHSGDYTTEEFAKFNRTGKKSKNATEKAVEISKTVKPEAVKSIADVITGYDTMGDMWADRGASRKIMNSLVESGVIGKNDMAQYYTEEGGMSAAGKEFVETCLIGSIMNESNIRTLSGDGGKAIRQKLVRAIVPLVENKGDGKEYSFNNELNEAVRIASFVAKNRGAYPTIKTYLEQQDMFDAPPSPIVKKLAEMIHDGTQKEFAEQMRTLEAGIRPSAAGEMDIFLGECETRDSVINRILKIKDSVRKSVFSTFDYVQKAISDLRKCKAI